MTARGFKSIRSKLIWLTTAISVTAVVLVTAANAWRTFETRREALELELTAVAGILAANLEASLVFGDRAAARETLSALSSRPAYTYAILTDATGEVFATHGKVAPHGVAPTTGVRLLADRAQVTVVVGRSDKVLGRLQIGASLESLRAAIWEILQISGAIMVGAILVSWLLAVTLGRAISRPIERLVATMESVSADHDFSRRAAEAGDDETGTLVRGFNEMIATIQRYHAELAEARDRAENASQAKTGFLATMSHELRTPLNAIIGFSDIIRGELLGPLSERYRSYGGDIHNSAKYLLNLINDLLDMSRLESNAYKLYEEELELGAIIRECEIMLGPQASRKGVSLRIAPASIDATVCADDRGLRQVLLNLLGNAIKFTPDGGRVEISTAVESDGAISVAVSDTGPGIAKEDLERVMEPFEQVRSHLSREHGGTGLGLAISRGIVELHGGTLILASEPGNGTTARFTLPRHRIRRLAGAAL